MTAQPFRNPAGGRIDRTSELRFTFNDRRLAGHPGDTLASALLANGVRLVGRSFKYHRPRGVFGAGVEEPNALVQLGRGARTEPNVRATQIELYQGLEAASQNCWPSVRFDLGAVLGALGPLLPAGFYYKTFMAPAAWWMTYERYIRKAAGLGRSPTRPDPDRYEQTYAFADVLVVGAGPAGLAAALAAGRTGARVLLVEDAPTIGGTLLVAGGEIDRLPVDDWIGQARAELGSLPEVTLLTRTTAFGYYDHDLVALAERVADHVPEPPPHLPRQRLWRVRAHQVVLATGAIERPIVFADNDRPGVMLASAAQAYANRYAVRAGRRAVVFTNNDSAYAAARDLAAAGIEVAAVVDARPSTREGVPNGARHLLGHVVARALGGRQVEGAIVAPLAAGGDRLTGPGERIDCDLLCVSGGWNPTLHLHAQSGARPVYDEARAMFVPGRSVQRERSAGSARGLFTLKDCLEDGFDAGRAAAAALGFDVSKTGHAPLARNEEPATPLRALWAVPELGGRKGFVDHQNDVTTADVGLAVREGYEHVEHLKRYTTLGMGTDQGRTSNVAGLALMAGIRGREIPAVGTTTFRPPFAPVTLGTFAGGETGPHLAPVRRTAMHAWHESAGAAFVNAGLWRRPAYYPRSGEDLWAAICREACAVRAGVGMVDVSTLGKIDLQGPDAAKLLDRVYINGWSRLPVGRCRYGVMLREDGIVFDDGTTARLGEHHYLMTTTTAHAAAVIRHLEFLLQVVWPELDVHVVSVTEEWAQVALAGPRSRDVLARLAPEIDVSDQALPFMGVCAGTVAGVPGRIFRISFSGELAYEIAVPADYGQGLWETMLEVGRPFDITPYGTEAMNILRIEKGHVTGSELNGRTSADDLGFGRMLSRAKPFLGQRSLTKPALVDERRRQLVGLVPADRRTRIPRGAMLVADAKRPAPNPIEGEVTSTCWSPNLERPIALALLSRGRARMGERLVAASPLRGETVEVDVTHPVFIDPEGERLRG